MAFIMMEGFEQIDPSVNLTALQFEKLLLAVPPDTVTDWFSGAGDAVTHEASGRIANNCMVLKRGANIGGLWADKYVHNMGFAFAPKQKVTLGFAVKFSKVPTAAIPLCAMRYDNGVTSQEQFSVWASTDGKIYVSTATVSATYLSQASPTVNTAATSLPATLRLTSWNYIEVSIDYSVTVPTLSILVNGTYVLKQVAHASLKRFTGEPYVSSVHVFNPTIQGFGNTAFNQYVDDLYVTDGNILGPQYIVPLTNGAIVTGVGNTTPSPVYPGGPVVGDISTLTFDLGDLPVGVGTVNGIAANVICSIASGVDGLTMGFLGSTTLTVGKNFTVNPDQGEQCFRFVSDTMPVPNTKNEAGVNALRGRLFSNGIF